jgi:hypothetical protein
MSNVKEVQAEGYIPFNTSEDEEVTKFLGYLNSPSNGIRIEYTGKVNYVENNHGGKTAMYYFTITGEEGYREEFFTALANAFIRFGGDFKYFRIRDVQNDTPFWDVLKNVPTYYI